MALRVSLTGLGALGILYADFLHKKPELCTLTCIADKERQARYAANGILCNGRPLKLAFMAPDEKPAHTADLMIVAVKGTTLCSAIRDMRRHIGPGTIVLSLLNGITSEEFIEEAYPDALVLRCVAQGMDALREGQHLFSSAPGLLIIGAPASRPELKAPLTKVMAFLAETGIPARLDEDIEHRLYAKWMLNVGLNQTVTAFFGTYGTTQQPGRARDLCIGAMREAMAIAGAEGVNLTEDDLNEYISIMDSLNPQSMPSMRQDVLAGRPTEKDLFAGTVLEKGRRLGISTPINAWLWDELCKIEAGMA